jgi:uncharacterized protein YjbI with pentapeptide repeats
MEFCDFSGGYLVRSDFSKSDMRCCKFIGTEINDTAMIDSNLLGAYFTESNIELGNFTRANMRGVEFGKADIGRSIFRFADLSGARFHGAKIDDHTSFEGSDNRLIRLEDNEIIETLD